MKLDIEYFFYNGIIDLGMMRYVLKRWIIVVVLGIIVFKVFLLYLVLMYVDNLNYGDEVENFFLFFIVFSEFRNEELIIIEISLEVFLDDLE